MKCYIIERGWDTYDCQPKTVGAALTLDSALKALEIVKTQAENDERGRDVKIILRWEEKDVQTYDRAHGYLKYWRLWWKYSKQYLTDLDIHNDEYYDQEMSDEIVGIREVEHYA